MEPFIFYPVWGLIILLLFFPHSRDSRNWYRPDEQPIDEMIRSTKLQSLRICPCHTGEEMNPEEYCCSVGCTICVQTCLS